MNNDICKKLLDTYNSNYLDTLSQESQKFFKDIANTFKGANVGKTTLIKLIYNHYNEKKPIVSKLSGPLTLSHFYSQKDNKRIYIFGERHGTENSCKPESGVMDIDEYFKELIRTTDVFLDFYIELPYKYIYKTTNGKYPYEIITQREIKKMSYINRIQYNFMKCAYSSFRDKECMLARLHFIDVRKREVYGIAIHENFFGEFQDDLQEYDNSKLLKKYRPMFVELKKSQNEVIKYVVSKIKETDMNIKELKKSTLGNVIYDFCEKVLIGNIKKNYSVVNKISTRILSGKKINEDDLEEISEIFSDWNTTILDMYTLARIYKKFNTSKPPYRDGIPFNQPEEPRNIIIYAGDFHARVYRDFFSFMGYKEVEKSGRVEKDRCLNMSNFKQPLFSTI